MKSLLRKACVSLFVFIYSVWSISTFAAVPQWVKITSEPNRSINFSVDVENLDASFIDCGYKCRLVKLNTTPFTSDGTVIIKLSSRCNGETDVRLPFSVVNGYLETALTVYHKSIGSEYCGFQDVDVLVDGDPSSKLGYRVKIIIK